jgi:hypothetical protein
MQIIKYSDIQLFIYADIHVFKYSNIQIFTSLFQVRSGGVSVSPWLTLCGGDSDAKRGVGLARGGGRGPKGTEVDVFASHRALIELGLP